VAGDDGGAGDLGAGHHGFAGGVGPGLTDVQTAAAVGVAADEGERGQVIVRDADLVQRHAAGVLEHVGVDGLAAGRDQLRREQVLGGLVAAAGEGLFHHRQHLRG